MVVDRTKQPQTRGEEIANAITHGIGFLIAVACLVLLVVYANSHGTVWHVVSCSIYGSTLVILYLASTLYHSLSVTKAGKVLRIIDHSSIYLLVAGTYTPFALGPLRGPWGWTIFGLVWGIACFGILFESFFIDRYKFISLLAYVGLGWLVVIALDPLLENLPRNGFIWLAVGGVFYTAGIIFYVMKSVKYAHAIWHLFVLAGSICHFFSVMFYVVLVP